MHEQSITLGKENIILETGKWAKQADGSVVYKCGNLVMLATVCAADDARESQDFFPLTVEYSEKMYAVGKFPGGYIKRESKPSEHEILISRLIDRPIRPMFPKGYFSEVQIVVQVLSSDKNISLSGHAITAASACLMVSDIPFSGPIAGVRVGRVKGELFINPPNELMSESDLDLVVAGTEDSIVMIEGEAKELSNAELLKALSFALESIQQLVSFQKELAAKVNKPKRSIKLKTPNQELLAKVREYSFERLSKANLNKDKLARAKDISAIYEETLEYFRPQVNEEDIKDIKNYLHEMEAEVVRDLIFAEGIRYDGRKLDEIRDISIEINVLPGAHGSAVFTRGQTQSLGVMTLGTIADNQRIENLEGAKEKVFMLHYNFPGFSVGEVKKSSGPGRREIGHGNLAERALKSVIPKFSDFPYVIRVVSEILESNGSSSMASVCSCSLALMAGGVPVKSSVAGVAMGLITDSDKKNYAILSDIAGIEDHFGDMDFKLAGTRKGITAFQMDLKITGVGLDVLEKVFIQAEKGRNAILDIMDKSIAKAASSLSKTAPRILIKQIPKERIGELIGTGGKMIRSIIEQSKADINIDDEGRVTISSPDEDSAQKAIELIDAIFEEVRVGKIYQGKVKKIADYGAFVEILPGREGLLHVSKIDSKRIASVRDVLNEGDIIPVKVIAIDERTGKFDLSRKDALN